MLSKLSLVASTMLCSMGLHAGYDVIGVGAACIDMVYQVDDEFLSSLSLMKGNNQRAADGDEFSAVIQQCDEKLYPSLITTGGSGANTIKGMASLGDRCAFIGKIGPGPMGLFFKNVLKMLGIAPLLRTSTLPTTQVAVFATPDKQRTFFTLAVAGHDFHAEDLDPEDFKGVRLVHIDGYAFDEADLIEQAMRYAKDNGAIVSVDMGCMRVVDNHRETILRLIKEYADIVFGNEDEIEALVGTTQDHGCAALSQYCSIGVVLGGAQGCWVGVGGTAVHYPTTKIDPIDTTGAGDLFASGFLHGILKGYTLADCAYLGNLTGGAVITVLGAEIPPEKWAEIKASMAQHSL